MYSKTTVIVNESGLHARPAHDFVNTAKKFSSKITIKNMDDPEAEATNAKSMVMLLAEGIAKDNHVEISANGEDEVQAVDELVALIETGFGE